METKKLVADACNGSIEALGELTERYWRFAVGAAFYYVRNLADAEDIAQDAFISAYLSLRRLKDGAKFAAWLRGIIRNRANMFIRSRYYIPGGLTPGTPDVGKLTDGTEPSPEYHLLQKELSKQIDEAFSDLPDLYREIAVLRYFSEMSYQEIADVLELPITTVSYRLRHANALMRKGLEKFMDYGKIGSAKGQAYTGKITRILELVTQGCDFAKKGDLDLAISTFKKASQIAHDSSALHMEIANRLLQSFIQEELHIGLAEIIESELERAYSGGLANLYWTDGAPINPWDAYSGLALLYVHLKEFDKAKEMFEKARALGQPYDLNEGQWFGNQGLYAEQVAFYRNILEKHGDDCNGAIGEFCRFCIAAGLTGLERYEEALSEYGSLISEGIDPAFGWYMTAYIYALRNDEAEFLKAVSKAVERDLRYAEKAKTQGVFAKYRGLAEFQSIVG